MMCLINLDPEIVSNISQELTIVLNDYEVTTRETALAIRNEDKNKYFFQKFLIAKTVKGCTQNTLKVYKTELSRIIGTIDKSIDEITSDDIRYYLALRQKRDNVSKTTVGNELRYLKSFFNFLKDDELIVHNPVAKIEKIKSDRKKKEAFTELDIEKIRNACETTREKMIVEVFLSTGCRVGELVKIKLSDVESDKLIVHGKGEKDRTVYLNAKAMIAIENYIKERKDSNPYLLPKGYDFARKRYFKDMKNWYRYPENVNPTEHTDKSCIEQVVRKIGKRAGVKNTHPHRFRRTCATFALRRGMPVIQVSKMLGHEDISTTQVYLDLSEEDLYQAHKKYVV